MTALPYRALWRRELACGLRTATTFDHVWRAAMLQIRAEDELQMLRESLDAHDHPDTIAHFLEQYEADCRACHEAFVAGEGGRDAAA